MKITLNGELKEIAEGSSAFDLVTQMAARPERVALERNREVLPRSKWKETRLHSGDAVEIVHLVGGG
jgi:thiamine biosynthesis protein ThiS